MSQTISIILPLREEETTVFEAMFEETIVSMWHEFMAEGKILAASLTPVEDGSETRPGVRDYILHVEARGMAEHDEFDTHPRFLEWVRRAETLLAGEPMVWFGTTRFQAP